MSNDLVMFFQLAADIVLCVTIIFFLRTIVHEIKQKTFDFDSDSLSELRKMMEESRRSTEECSRALEHGRESIKELVAIIDEKQRQLQSLLQDSNAGNGPAPSAVTNSRGRKYADISRMAEQGLGKREISELLGMPEGEVSLILELERSKNEQG